MTKGIYRNCLVCVLLLLATTLLPVAGRAEGVTPFVHPGLLNNLDELKFIKDKVNRRAVEVRLRETAYAGSR